jgi:thiol:disulfide interchange protein DsbD
MRPRLAVVFAIVVVLILVPALAWAAAAAPSQFNAWLERYGVAASLALSFGAGIVASLTPCVWPMVPITVSIFGATEARSRVRGMALSATFVLGIAALFAPLGVASAMTGALMGAALSKAWVIVGFALLFSALAASMFGAFEMALPSRLANRLSSVGGVGFKGAFVLGLCMGLIAAPCTGPFLTGLLAWIATTRNVAVGGGAMFAFALGLGVPFFVAGTFATNLPKGGAWMLGIKWVSGVLLAYMALAYLRDRFPALAFLVSPRSLYGGVAAALVAAGLGLGVVHVIAERRRLRIARWSRPAKLASIAPAIAGLFMLVSWAKLKDAHEVDPTPSAMACTTAEPIAWLTDEAEAKARARAEKKPLLVDFGAGWCPSCVEMDRHVWLRHQVRCEAKRFVALKVDLTDDDAPEAKALQKKYGVGGLPAVVLIGSDGEEKARHGELKTPQEAAAALAAVH